METLPRFSYHRKASANDITQASRHGASCRRVEDRLRLLQGLGLRGWKVLAGASMYDMALNVSEGFLGRWEWVLSTEYVLKVVGYGVARCGYGWCSSKATFVKLSAYTSTHNHGYG